MGGPLGNHRLNMHNQEVDTLRTFDDANFERYITEPDRLTDTKDTNVALDHGEVALTYPFFSSQVRNHHSRHKYARNDVD